MMRTRKVNNSKFYKGYEIKANVNGGFMAVKGNDFIYGNLERDVMRKINHTTK